MKYKAIILAGPTATSKSDLSIALSQNFPIEIINVDSALVYNDMDIGNAKPNKGQLNLVPHHLINIISPLEVYSVGNFVSDCLKLIVEINNRNKIPLLVGGTMMYFNALLNGLSQLPKANLLIRNNIENNIRLHGLGYVYNALCEIDIRHSLKINVNDTQRIIRAMEIYELTGKSIFNFYENNFVNSNIDFLKLSINPFSRAILHDRIQKRLQFMIAGGIVDEVIFLKEKYANINKSYNSQRLVGYKQVWEYLEENCNFEQMHNNILFATRQLAKRQITWLKKLSVFENIDNLEKSLDFESLLKRINVEIEKYLNCL